MHLSRRFIELLTLLLVTSGDEYSVPVYRVSRPGDILHLLCLILSYISWVACNRSLPSFFRLVTHGHCLHHLLHLSSPFCITCAVDPHVTHSNQLFFRFLFCPSVMKVPLAGQTDWFAFGVKSCFMLYRRDKLFTPSKRSSLFPVPEICWIHLIYVFALSSTQLSSFRIKSIVFSLPGRKELGVGSHCLHLISLSSRDLFTRECTGNQSHVSFSAFFPSRVCESDIFSPPVFPSTHCLNINTRNKKKKRRQSESRFLLTFAISRSHSRTSFSHTFFSLCSSSSLPFNLVFLWISSSLPCLT